ncbi:MAG: alkaline phosphatase D family protein [Bacteroidetes bacterium]|nr:alkaline phosphatase D family protein [Bacteroidota bacterium]
MRIFSLMGLILIAIACSAPENAIEIQFADSPDRTWIGPQFYANRMLDWELRGGRLQSIEGRAAKPMRTVHLLTRYLMEEEGSLNMSVVTGAVNTPDQASDSTWTGFLVGAGGTDVDYRISAMVHHWPAPGGGLFVGIDGTGHIVVRDNENPDAERSARADFTTKAWPLIESKESEGKVLDISRVGLRVMSTPNEGTYSMVVEAFDPDSEAILSHAVYQGLDPKYFSGSVALVSHRSPSSEGAGYWFDHWTVEGSKVVKDESRAFGPVLGVQYTVSEGILKMTAQMGPLGPDDAKVADLQIQQGSTWKTIASGELDTNGYTIGFRVEDWTEPADTPFRVMYSLWEGPTPVTHYYDGTIHSQISGDEFVLAALNCQHIAGGDGSWTHENFWWPHADMADAVAYHKADMYFFAGDQIYEGGLEGIVRAPADTAILDYLSHWNRFLWAFGDLTRHRPTVTIPDDHDVYHGNVWGAGGKSAEGPFNPAADNGGYIEPAEFVNAVHRTQSSHLPDPYDSTPIEQGISVYYTNMEFGGVSFAILADRMFKSAPRTLLPAAKIVNGWPSQPGWDAAKSGDHKGAVLLGDRQHEFLDDWVKDWGTTTWMKVFLSQTLFANVASIPEGDMNGSVIPGLAIPPPGEVVKGYKKAMDMDSNAWPQSGRNRVVRDIRRARAFHVAGDQHLGSTVQYGVDAFADAGYAFVVPSIANIWPRRWFPPEISPTRDPNKSWYTGDHLDGFGNHMTVLAVANPVDSGQKPSALFDRTPGYGIIRMNKVTRDVVFEAWPRWVNPTDPGAKPYSDWPISFNQTDGDGRQMANYLVTLEYPEGMAPAIEVIDTTLGDHVYTFRPAGTSYKPPIYDDSHDYQMTITYPDGVSMTYAYPRGRYPSSDVIKSSLAN